jgi:hypothetical protein
MDTIITQSLLRIEAHFGYLGINQRADGLPVWARSAEGNLFALSLAQFLVSGNF